MGSYPSSAHLIGGAGLDSQDVMREIRTMRQLDQLDEWRTDRDYALRRLQMHATALRSFQFDKKELRDIYAHAVLARNTAIEDGVVTDKQLAKIDAIPAEDDISIQIVDDMVQESLTAISRASPDRSLLI